MGILARVFAVLSALAALPGILSADSCAITSVSQVSSVVSNCTTITVSSFSVPAVNQPLIMNLKAGTQVTFTGQVLFEKNAFNGYLMEIIGDKINVTGTSTHQLHGNGQLYWDGKGGAGTIKPTFLYLKGTGGSFFSNLVIKNCPHRCVAIDGSNNLDINNFLIDNREGAPGTAAVGHEGHNTDGFDIAKSQYVTLRNSIIYNQDDCVAINQGSHFTIDNLHCDGSHGFDIATGMDKNNQTQNQVFNVTFKNSILNNGMYGLHILTCNDGGIGYVKQVTYQNITFNGPSDYGIMIQQDFSNAAQGSTGNPVGNVPVSDITYNHINGSMNGQFSSALSLRCAAGACSNIVFNDVTITNAKSKNECWNYTISGWC